MGVRRAAAAGRARTVVRTFEARGTAIDLDAVRGVRHREDGWGHYIEALVDGRWAEVVFCPTQADADEHMAELRMAWRMRP